MPKATTVPHDCTTLATVDITSFCAGARDPAALRHQLESSLEAGSTRPEWCWLAVGDTGGIVARHCWWGRRGARRPRGVARQDLVEVLRACDFEFEVSRVSVEWSAGGDALDSGRLVFRPAQSVAENALVGLFAAVTDGSLDHGMISDHAELGAEGEARARLARARSYRAESDWFRVAVTPAGECVGYVVPALSDDAPMIAEIGVVASHRGNGCVHDLLGWATRLLASKNAGRIVADTDRANAPMRAAFQRAGYREVQWRDDHQCKRDAVRQR